MRTILITLAFVATLGKERGLKYKLKEADNVFKMSKEKIRDFLRRCFEALKRQAEKNREQSPISPCAIYS